MPRVTKVYYCDRRFIFTDGLLVIDWQPLKHAEIELTVVRQFHWHTIAQVSVIITGRGLGCSLRPGLPKCHSRDRRTYHQFHATICSCRRTRRRRSSRINSLGTVANTEAKTRSSQGIPRSLGENQECYTYWSLSGCHHCAYRTVRRAASRFQPV